MTLDPITLLIFLLFIVLPIINSLMRGQQQRPGQPGQPGQQRPRGPSPQAGQGTGGAGPSADDTFARRLEEARRRVQEAMGDTVAQSGPGERTSTAGHDTGRQRADTLAGGPRGDTIAGSGPRPTVAGEEARRTIREPAPQQQGQYQPAQRLDSHDTLQPRHERLGERAFESVAGQRPERPPERTRAPQHKVQKRLAAVEKLHPKDIMRFDAKGVYRGMIWHQILGEPRAKRPHRRKPSRRP